MESVLYSAKTSARSRRQPLQTVLVVEPTEDRSRHDPRVTRELVARNQERRQPRRWLGKARAEARVRAAAIGVCLPCAKNPSPGVLAERDQEVQALPAETAEQSFTDRVRPGRLNRGAEDPDTHRGDGAVQPGRVDAIPIVEDESIRVRCSEDLLALLQGPSGRRMPRDVDVHEPDWTPTAPGADAVQGSAP
jgi:hypothetical protein